MFTRAVNPLLLTGRVAAILALSALMGGRLVHLGQQCGTDCCSPCSVARTDVHSHTHAHNGHHGLGHGHGHRHEHCHSSHGHGPCHGGLSHTDESLTEIPAGGGSAPCDHDEHSCAVCSVLAQTPSSVTLLTSVDQVEYVCGTIKLQSDSGAPGYLAMAKSRGPPSEV